MNYARYFYHKLHKSKEWMGMDDIRIENNLNALRNYWRRPLFKVWQWMGVKLGWIRYVANKDKSK